MMQRIRLNGELYSPTNLACFVATAKSPKEQEFYQEICSFLSEWFDSKQTVRVQTSGSTGRPKALEVRKTHMQNSAKLTCTYFGLKPDDSALLCMPVRYIAGKMMLVRAVVCRLSLWVAPPTSHPLINFDGYLSFAAMVPMQVYNSTQTTLELIRLKQIKTLLIGGGAIDKALEEDLALFPGGVYSSYGMTETVSHIAIRQLNGANRSAYYTALPEVELSQLATGALIIWAPLVCEERLTTNDLVAFDACGRFKILGRIDNVINSGGIKLQAEEIEEKLKNLIPSPYVITSVSDAILGESVTLLIAGKRVDVTNLQDQIREVLTSYELPKYIFYTDTIPMTLSQKIQRAACKKIAHELYNQELK